ncbi:MAG: 50S ribosomal protein L10 [Candidatus Nitrospinota bacterium M3_3B_026]
MVTEAKKTEVEQLRDNFTKANVAVIASFSGVTVEKVTTLRKDLRGADARLKVVKNTLARIAADDTPFAEVSGMFQGPVSVTFGFGEDLSAPAKKLLEFAKDNEGLTILGGVIDGAALGPEEVKQLANTPPRPVLQAMFLGLMQAPARNFMGVMEGAARKFLYALSAVAEKKREEGGA